MENKYSEITTIESQPGIAPDQRSLSIEMADLESGTDPLEHLQEKLGADLYDKFSWSSSFDGSTSHILSMVRDVLPEDDFNNVFSKLNNIPAVTSVCLLHEYSDADEPQKIETAKLQSVAYDSSWYWPVATRLPKSDYTAPAAIRIAQADTGVSMQPCLKGGFKPADSMNFFYPPNERKGRGVICWDRPFPYSPFFISHGTSTGGLMVGEPADGLNLYGMTIRDVVELVPCRVADSVVLNPPDLTRLTECINWAVDEGIKVINVSLGAVAFKGDPAHSELTKAVENAYKKGVIICAAAGQLAPGMIWPGIYSMKGWVIACGPSKAGDTPSAQSIWGAFQNGYATIAAPGEDMPQAGWKGGVCSKNEPELGSSLGSSYSAAYTSSVAALWWARNYDSLSKLDPRDIVPLFRNTIQNTCTPWNGNYNTAKFSPGILDPNKAITSMVPPHDHNVESSGKGHVERIHGGTYRNLTLHAHNNGSIHVLNPVFVEGKLTLISESGASISMSGTIICRKLEIKIESSSLIEADDLEYYDNCHVNIAHASTLRAHIAAEGPMSGSVTGPKIWNGSTLRAWIHWRNGRKDVSISKDWMSTIDIGNWSGRWM